MHVYFSTIASLLVLAGICVAGGCENPASFKKCLAQTRAEVNICGINMTCKCLRQENVVRCYEKCGDDSYYRRLKLGEKGQQQIFCSQKQPGESEDMPIIGSEGGPVDQKSEKKPDRPVKANAKPAQPAPPPPPPPAPARPDAGDRHRDGVDNAGRMTGATMMDFDNAAAGIHANVCLSAAAALLAIHAL